MVGNCMINNGNKYLGTFPDTSVSLNDTGAAGMRKTYVSSKKTFHVVEPGQNIFHPYESFLSQFRTVVLEWHDN
jgi:hypothetical protein